MALLSVPPLQELIIYTSSAATARKTILGLKLCCSLSIGTAGGLYGNIPVPALSIYECQQTISSIRLKTKPTPLRDTRLNVAFKSLKPIPMPPGAGCDFL